MAAPPPIRSDCNAGRWLSALRELAGAVLVLLAASGARAAGPVPPPGVSTSLTTAEVTARETNAGPARLKKSTQLVLATNEIAKAGGGTNAPAPQAKSFSWKLAWQGWEGLQLEAVQRTPLKNPIEVLGLRPSGSDPLSYLQLEQVKLSGKLGALVEVDGAAFATGGGLTGFDPGVQLRRLRISAGGDCILVLPVSYFIQLGYGAGNFYLNQSSLTFPAIPYLGNLQVGQFQAPMGLDLITSSRDLTFMEPAAPLQAIAPGIEAGAQIGQPIFNQRATWAFGLFAPGVGALEYGNASRNFGSAVGRATWLPIYHPDLEHPAANRFLHLGLSVNLLYSSSSTVRYRSRPESYIAPVLLDTGDIAADRAVSYGGEVAWVNGPLSVQGEFIRSTVGQNGSGNLACYGYYANASWYLTGESRPYDATAGAFKRLITRHNFNFGKGGWGAVELAGRFSHTDLNDGPVQGGRLSLLLGGVNWYLQPHVRWMFNSGVGRLSGGWQAGDLFLVQTRIGVDF